MKEIKMPSLSPTMESGKIVKWIKKEGEDIKIGDIIAEIETDKASMEYESEEEGKLGKIIMKEGEEVKVGKVIGIILEEGEEHIEEYKAEEEKTENKESGNEKINNNDNSYIDKVWLSNNENFNYSNTVDNNYLSNSFVFKNIDAFNKSIGAINHYDGPYKKMTVREALLQAIREEMNNDKLVFIMGEEVAEYQGAYKVTQGLLQDFGPERVIDTPITEYGFTGIGVGSAYSGLRPIVEFMTFNFAMQAIDHIVNSASKIYYMSNGEIKCPIVFRGPNGAASRVAAQHSQCFGAWYSHIPGLIVMAPYSAEDAKGLLKAAIRNDNPVVFLENELLYGQSFNVPDIEDFILPIGKAKVEVPGNMVTIVSYSRGLEYALGAEKILKKEGISVEVINLRTLKPLDIETISRSVEKTSRLIIVEEGWSFCGVASEVAMQVIENSFDYLDAPPVRVSGKDVPMPYAANLEKYALPSVKEVVKAVKDII